MTKEIVIAAISAISGIACALFAWLQAVRTARLKASTEVTLARIKAESEIALERLKVENERQRKLIDQVASETRPVEEALSVAWQEIQAIKEEIDRLASSTRYDLDLAIAGLKSVVNGFVAGYAKWGHLLPEPVRAAWHSAKSSALGILQTLELGEAGAKERPRYRAQLVRQLRDARLRLTDQQMVLSAARVGLRDLYTLRAVNGQ